MGNKLPFMPLYVQDLLSDEAVMLMSNAEFGAYMKLLCHQWVEGSIPAHQDRAARICGWEGQDTWEAVWLQVFLPKFALDGEGRRANPRLAAERERAIRIADAKRRGGLSRAKQKESSRDAGRSPEAVSPACLPVSVSSESESVQRGSAGGEGSTVIDPVQAVKGLAPPVQDGDDLPPQAFRSFAQRVVDGYPKLSVGPRNHALDAACRMLAEMHQGAAQTAGETVRDAIALVAGFASATRGAGFLPHLHRWCDDGWWKMSEEEWRAHGRDGRDVARQGREQGLERAQDAARASRAVEREADALVRQEAVSGPQRAAALEALRAKVGTS